MAQVIPVLLLAAAFESKVLQRVPMRYGGKPDETDETGRVGRDTNFFQSVGMAIVLIFIGAGEALTIWCVYTGQHEPWQNAWVLLAGLTTLALVIGPLVTLHINDYRNTNKFRGVDWVARILILILIAGTIYTLWLVLMLIGVLVPTNPN